MSLQTFKSTSHWILGIRTEITDCRNQSWLWGKWDVEIGSTIWLKLNTFPRRLPHFPPTPSVTFKERQQWRIFSHVLFTRRGVCLPFFLGSFPRFGFWLLLSTMSRSRDFRLSLALRPQSEVFTVYTRFRLNLHFNLFARCLCFPLCLPAPFCFLAISVDHCTIHKVSFDVFGTLLKTRFRSTEWPCTATAFPSLCKVTLSSQITRFFTFVFYCFLWNS